VLPALSIILTSLGAWALDYAGLMVNTIAKTTCCWRMQGLPKRRMLWW